MSKNNNTTVTNSIAPFFVIRTPRLSLELLSKFADESNCTNAILEQWLALDGVLEAVYLASPSLLERIELWRQKPESKQGKKVAQALLKYMLRMCSRATPFGLFSGVYKGQLTEQSTLQVKSHQQDLRKTRLDMFYLSALKEHIVKQASSLNYKPNSSHYFVANQCRYIEGYLSNNNMQYRLSAVESDEYFKFVMQAAAEGKPFSELVSSFMCKYPEAEQTQVEEYIQALVDEKVLQADLPLPLTGESPDLGLLRSLEQAGELDIADKLATALTMLERLDHNSDGSIKPYQQLIEHFQTLPVKAEENKLFQTDVYRSFEHCQIDNRDVQRVVQKLELIAELSNHKVNNPLDRFISQFNARFEGQFVPLDVVLDDESGISVSNETGYEAPLIAGLNLAREGGELRESSAATPLDLIVEQAISLPENRNKDCIVLKSKELKQKKASTKTPVSKDFPASFAVMLSIFEDQKHNTVFKFNGCGGPSSANLIGRFCHLNEELKEELITELKREESHSEDVIFAEVAHMPEGRPGNVIARPHLRQYEIVFMADSSLDEAYQIPLSDLYVWVEGEKVKLWSKRLNKQVVPRLSCAHNYSSRSLSAYKFLCMMQHQDGKPPVFNLPSSTVNATFVPRIMLDNLILSEKTWRINRKELVSLYNDGDLDKQQLSALLDKYQLDPQVSYAMADNVLQLDLRRPELLAILLNETKGRERVELKEVLTSQLHSAVTDTQGNHYSNEVILPVFNANAAVHRHYTHSPLEHIQAAAIKRRFSAGSEWLSVKIYSGNSVLEQLLIEKILPFIAEHQQDYKKWFFIRYGDPSWHLRLRFLGEPEKLCGELLPKLNQLLSPMIEQGELQKVELMTYEREVERYGGPESMALVESLFMADSEMIAKACQLVEEYGEDVRWRIATLCSDRLLTLFGYSPAEKLALISTLRAAFGREFNETSVLRKQLGQRYREYQTQLDSDFKRVQSSQVKQCDDSQKAILALLQNWQQQAQPVVNQILVLNDKGCLNCSKDTLLGSLLHMHNNRMFKAYGREQELVIHDMLRRKYFSSQQLPEQ